MGRILHNLWVVVLPVVAAAFTSPKPLIETHYPSWRITKGPSGLQDSTTCSRLYAQKDDDKSAAGKNPSKGSKSKSSGPSKKKKRKNPTKAGAAPASQEEKERKRAQVAKAAAKLIPRKNEGKSGLLDKINPFQAGQNFRKTLDSAITSLSRAQSGSDFSATATAGERSIYYLDDRFRDSGGGLFAENTNPYLTRLEQENYIPEVLVVGATGELGRLVCQRLLLEGRCRVRVLVRDLFSRTLNMLGTGVTYCQGDLSNIGSLEYALTDVDKIVFCAAPPRPGETDFQEWLDSYMNQEHQKHQKHQKQQRQRQQHQHSDKQKQPKRPDSETIHSDSEWERLNSILEVRAELAEQVDYTGMKNLISAYQNVRYADYGTSQSAKRSLFKFQGRPEDFNLFSINYYDDGNDDSKNTPPAEKESSDDNNTLLKKSQSDTDENFDESYYASYDDYAEAFDDYQDDDDDDDDYDYKDDDDDYADYAAGVATSSFEPRNDATVKSQCQWIRNDFGNGIFVGRVPQQASSSVGGEASVISSRLSSRESGPDDGIDLGVGFGGFVCRLCSDGGTYEMFIQTGAYDEDGIEYVCEFTTATKPTRKGNASRNKFVSIRLPFENFQPIRKAQGREEDKLVVAPFVGKDVRRLGFRYRSSSNKDRKVTSRKGVDKSMSSFYLGLSYIKLYRVQPEPEFVYLSDARIPPVVRDSMVKHSLRKLVCLDDLTASEDGAFQILDDAILKMETSDRIEKSSEETYYKFRGEEILKQSGLSYAIVRIAGFNESPSGEMSAIDLKASNAEEIVPVSRAEAAQVCVNALLEPNALNKSFYLSKKTKGSALDENLSLKFRSLPMDPI